MMQEEKRARFLAWVLEQMGSPYRWDGKGETLPDGQRVFDCSGLVTCALHAVGGPDWRADYNTSHLLAECRRVDEARPGTLVLYGDPHTAGHVMVHVGAGVLVGASGGGHTTLTLEDAHRQGARVRTHVGLDYRPDRVALVELPYLEMLAVPAASVS